MFTFSCLRISRNRDFFRNVTERLVEVERYNSNTQNVLTWTGGVSIMGAIQNLIVCVKMARGVNISQEATAETNIR